MKIKEKRIKILIIALLLFLVGFTKVNAASYSGFDYTAKLYDNVNGTITSVTTNGPYNEGLYEGYIPYTANSSGGAWLISSPLTLVANHTYTLTASIPNECGPLTLSSANRIGVGTIVNNAKASYQNNTDVNEVYSRVIGGNYFLIQFAFTPTINGSYIVFPFATSVSCESSRTILSNIVIDDLGINSATEEQINTSLNNQTNTINNSIQNSTDTIINNQNQNNEELKDTINDNFNSCKPSVNLFDNKMELGNINSSGLNYNDTSSIRTIDYIKVNPNTNYIISNNGSKIAVNVSFYNSNKEFISRTFYNGTSFTTSSDTEYIRFQTSKIENYKFQLQEGTIITKYEPFGEVCSNKIDETNDKLNGIQGALTDSSTPNLDSLEDSIGWLPPGPVDSILNLPLTMLNSLTNSLTKTCSPLNLTLPYVNKNIQIPCLSAIFAKITGVNGLWTWVGAIASVLILYNYLLNLYAWVDKVLTLRAEFDEAMGADLANWGRL